MWLAVFGEDGRVFYYNEKTHETTWKRPQDSVDANRDLLCEIEHIHCLSKLQTCIRMTLERVLRHAFKTWSVWTEILIGATTRKFVLPLANMFSEWMKMKSVATVKVAEVLLLKEQITRVTDRVLALEKVEMATLEWELLSRDTREKKRSVPNVV